MSELELLEYTTDWSETPPRTAAVTWFVREVAYCTECGIQERFRSDRYWAGALCEHIARGDDECVGEPTQLDLWNNLRA